jgi:hypothetical protein
VCRAHLDREVHQSVPVAIGIRDGPVRLDHHAPEIVGPRFVRSVHWHHWLQVRCHGRNPQFLYALRDGSRGFPRPGGDANTECGKAASAGTSNASSRPRTTRSSPPPHVTTA